MKYSKVIKGGKDMNCPNCGVPLNDGTIICTNCGTDLRNTGMTKQGFNQNFNQSGIPTQGFNRDQGFMPYNSQGQPQNYGGNNMPPKKNTGLIVGIIIGVVLIAAIVVAAVLLLKKNKDDETTTTAATTTEMITTELTTEATTTEAATTEMTTTEAATTELTTTEATTTETSQTPDSTMDGLYEFYEIQIGDRVLTRKEYEDVTGTSASGYSIEISGDDILLTTDGETEYDKYIMEGDEILVNGVKEESVEAIYDSVQRTITLYMYAEDGSVENVIIFKKN